MSLLQLLHVFRNWMPAVDKLNPDKAAIHIAVTEEIGAVSCPYDWGIGVGLRFNY